MMAALVFLIGIIVIWLIIPKLRRIRALPNAKQNFTILIIWVFLGFITRADNNGDFGCIIHSQSVFRLDNYIFTGISFVLISNGYLFRKSKFAIVLLFIEFISWVFKLFFIKGGYVVGISAGPNELIVLYDLIGLVFRINLLALLLNKPVKIVASGIVALIILSFKIFMPVNVHVDLIGKINKTESEIIARRYQGQWNGMLYYIEEITSDTSYTLLENPEDNPVFDLVSDIDTNVEYRNIYDSIPVKIIVTPSSLNISKNDVFTGNYSLRFKSSQQGHLSVFEQNHETTYSVRISKYHKGIYHWHIDELENPDGESAMYEILLKKSD